MQIISADILIQFDQTYNVCITGFQSLTNLWPVAPVLIPFQTIKIDAINSDCPWRLVFQKNVSNVLVVSVVQGGCGGHFVCIVNF